MVHDQKKDKENVHQAKKNEQESAGGQVVKSPPFQLFAGGDGGGGDAPAAQNKSASNSAMPEAVQAKMESAFGQDFSDVSIHTDSQVSKSAGALAHTQGNEVHFAPGQFKPETQSGQELLGHELTHVVQQRQGRVEATGSTPNGMPLNDNKGLESEADQMGKAAAAGTMQKKAAGGSGSPKGGASQMKKGPVQRKAFANDQEKEQFFADYQARADEILARWYEKTTTKDGRDKLTGQLFADAARKVYTAKGDTKFIVPVEFALSQARLEGGVSRLERGGKGNVFNVAAYDSGVSAAEKKIDTLEKGFESYYMFMANKMLDDKSPEQLLEKGNFTTGANRTGGVYATNPVYEGHIKGEIGKMHMADDGFRLSGSVGLSGKNKPEDVAKVAALLVKLGYMSKDDVADAGKVGSAILRFQTTEIAPTSEEWFKKRDGAVTNATDRKNMDIQLKDFKDGTVSNGGATLGVMYFMAAMGGKVELTGKAQKGGSTTPAKPATVTPAKPADTKPTEPKPATPTTKPATQPANSGSSSWWGDAWDYVAKKTGDAVDYGKQKAGQAYDYAAETVSGWGKAIFGDSEPAKKQETITPAAKQPAAKQSTPATPAAQGQISDSVGKGGKNNDADVRIVQTLLIKAGYLPALNSKGQSNVDGDCGNLTIGAITRFQSEKAGLSQPDGRVDAGGTTWKALTGQKVAPKPQTQTQTTPQTGGGKDAPTKVDQRPALTTTGDMFSQIKQNFPNGINVAIYADYDKTGDKAKDGNNAEFPRAAGAYAKSFNSVGYDASGTLKLGLAHPIKSLADITKIINDTHALLKREYEKSTTTPAAELPAYTKIKTLALFSHGMPWGMHLGGSGKYNLRIDSKAEQEKFKQFVSGIRGSLTADVDVNLFACNAGRETDGTEKEGVWGLDAAEKQDGSSSFGAALAAELGKDASVYAHLSAGHTVNNYSARVFGKDAGKDATQDKGGVHIFRLLYPSTFVESEAKRLGKTKEQVSAKMWKHFTQRMSDGHSGKFSITNAQGKAEKIQLGSEMFSDLERSKTILQTDWATWVQSNPIK
ncbi:MAG: DUF4157 domain-containing protein [Bacteroidia bacterium]